MRIAWCYKGKHANKAKFFAESAVKFGHQQFTLDKRSKKHADIIVTYGNYIPSIEPHQIWVNIHAAYFGRDIHHRISVGNYHPGYYIMDLDRPADRVAQYNIELKPWNTKGSKIIVCVVSHENMGIFDLVLEKEVDTTLKLIKQYTNKEIIIRDRTERFDSPLSDLFPDAWAMVTWSSNCAVEALIHGVPSFLRTGAAATPMSLTDLSLLEKPFYPTNRQQWIQNLAYNQFTTQ